MNIKVLLENGEYHLKGAYPGIHWIDYSHSSLCYSNQKEVTIDAKRTNCTTLLLLPDFVDISPDGGVDAYCCAALHIREDATTKQIWGFRQFDRCCTVSVHDSQGFMFSGIFSGVEMVQDVQGLFDMGGSVSSFYKGSRADRCKFLNEVEEIFRSVRNIVACRKDHDREFLEVKTSIIQY